MEEREVIFMGLCHRGSTTIYDHGGPDDLFADIGNFDLYAIFLLNLMVMEEIKIIPMGSNHHHNLGEPDDLFADTDKFAVYAIVRLNLMIWGQ
jgi:hypothetical protein